MKTAKGSKKGPLRKIVEILRFSENVFDYSLVKLECGHTAHAFGTYQARCRKCRKDA